MMPIFFRLLLYAAIDFVVMYLLSGSLCKANTSAGEQSAAWHPCRQAILTKIIQVGPMLMSSGAREAPTSFSHSRFLSCF